MHVQYSILIYLVRLEVIAHLRFALVKDWYDRPLDRYPPGTFLLPRVARDLFAQVVIQHHRPGLGRLIVQLSNQIPVDVCSTPAGAIADATVVGPEVEGLCADELRFEGVGDGRLGRLLLLLRRRR